ncbi:MAG: hypothetical protein HOW73_50060 [Polyangiaceae bacterium]|nr:hypothetical protein [Polyangiaceae bacterium]
MSATAAAHVESYPVGFRRHRFAVIEMLRARQLEVETFGVIRARLDAGRPLANVVASFGMDERTWRELDAALRVVLEAESRTGHHALARRYSEGYTQAWSALAPRFTAPTMIEAAPTTPREGRRSMPPTLMSEPLAPTAPTRTPQGTIVMHLEPIASGSEPVSDAELARYVRVSAALASARDRNVTLAQHGLSLQAWVDWSSRMGRRLGCDATLRARYSRLLHEAINNAG